MAGGGAREYHARDFEWEDLREEVEKDPSKGYHVAPPSSGGHRGDLLSSSSPHASEAWRSFHRRHSTGRFFKVFDGAHQCLYPVPSSQRFLLSFDFITPFYGIFLGFRPSIWFPFLD